MSQTNVQRTITATILGMFTAAILSFVAVMPASAGKPSNGPTIVDTAVAANTSGPLAGEFDTLIAAVSGLGLIDTLSGNKPYTVFAPTDAAFAALPTPLDPTSFDNLSAEDKASLTDIVLFHVTNGKRYSQSVVGDKQLRMANGDFAKTSGATIDGANIIGADVKASNGVIHVVDKVLLP